MAYNYLHSNRVVTTSSLHLWNKMRSALIFTSPLQEKMFCADFDQDGLADIALFGASSRTANRGVNIGWGKGNGEFLVTHSDVGGWQWARAVPSDWTTFCSSTGLAYEGRPPDIALCTK